MKRILKVGITIFIFFFLLFVGLNVYIFSSAQSSLFSVDEKFPQGYDIALLFGAGVGGTKLSHMLEDRALTAVDLYDDGIIEKILISADNSRENYDEVRPTRDFLIEKGVDSGAMYLDFAGFDSYDSLYRAKYLFGAEKLTLISQDFHLPRLLFICKGLHLDCIGVRADRRSYVSVWYNYTRETLANVKALFSIVFHVEPTFLGEKIPLTGESNAFWYD